MDSGITVTGAASATAPADLLRVTLGVGHETADVANAIDHVGVKTAAVIAALRAMGVEEGDIHTTGVHVFPVYEAEPARVGSYRASHSISVATKDLDGFGRLVSAAVDAAGNDLTVDQIGFDVADKSGLVVQAREAAFAEARKRADHLARLAGRELGRLESVEERPLHEPIGVPLSMSGKARLAPLDFGVEPGRQSVAVAVTIRWAWA